MPGFEPRGWEALIDQMEVESQEKPVSKGRQGKKKKKREDKVFGFRPVYFYIPMRHANGIM